MPLSCGVWPASSVPCFRGALRSAWAGTGLGADPGYMDALYRHPSDIYGEEVRPTASLFDPENRGIYTQSDSPKKSSRNIWSLAVVSVDQRY